MYQARISVFVVGFFAPLACALFTLAAPSGLRGRVRDGLPADTSLGGRLAVGGAEFVRVGRVGVADDVVVLGFESTELVRRGGCGVLGSADSDFVERTLELRLSFMGETFGGRKENRFPFYRIDE
ncbi:hypothetical protein ASNO1_43180 [Corallococcus caeni]|uniref:Uncharacterized protein n=1 Tax=Corallococcus caeni TaxID=3082388 RepID=A0ABQ6QVK7_9BACT|nr:hypothetical protein ASNO1_43180 [Corallococcus sp. NO1]